MSDIVVVGGGESEEHSESETTEQTSAQEELAKVQLEQIEQAKTEEIVDDKVDEKLEWTNQDIANHGQRLTFLEEAISEIRSLVSGLTIQAQPETEEPPEEITEIPAQSESDAEGDLEKTELEPYYRKHRAL
jgi:hypothetical protein